MDLSFHVLALFGEDLYVALQLGLQLVDAGDVELLFDLLQAELLLFQLLELLRRQDVLLLRDDAQVVLRLFKEIR